MKIKAAVVAGLEQACTWKDTHLPKPLAGFRGCWLATLSDRLDQRWGTAVWQVPQDAEAPYRTHWGQASDRCTYCGEPIHEDEYLVWHHTVDDGLMLGLELLCDPDQLDAKERGEIRGRFGDDGQRALAAADDARRRERLRYRGGAARPMRDRVRTHRSSSDQVANVPTQPLVLRDAGPPGVIVVVRLGSRTLLDDQLAQRCEVSFDRWGIHGFSVLEVPDRTNWALLASLRPEVATRPTLFSAEGRDLLEAGFPLLPTMAHPHWTVVLAEPTAAQFQHVREVFTGPLDNPAFAGRR